MADPNIVPADALTGLADAIIRTLAFGAMGIVFAGILATCLYNLFECRKLKRCHGRPETWQLMR
jgi:hypothetical protein